MVNVAGELDLATGNALVDRLVAVVTEGPPRDLVLNVGKILFCDSAGISALVRLRKMADEYGWRFALVDPTPSVLRVIELTGLDTYLNIDSRLGAEHE